MTALQQQIDELQSRVQSLDGTADRILAELTRLSQRSDERQAELLQRSAGREQLGGVEQRLQRLERGLESVQKEVASRDYQAQFRTLQDAVQKSHAGLFEHVQSTSNGIDSPSSSSFSSSRNFC